RPGLDEGVHLVILRDVMERRRREQADEEVRLLSEQLRQSQKMEAVGRLAGGVAHDFNNLLTAVLGYAELVLLKLSPKDPLRGHGDEIRFGAERAAALTQQLLAFSRKQIVQPHVLDLGAVVSDTSRFLRRLIGEDVELVSVVRPDIGRVKADRVQMEQV